MAYIEERHNRGGSVTFLARVKVRGFNCPAKAFSVADYKSRKAARAAAAEWAAARERALRDHRKRKNAAPSVATLTVRQLIEQFLADERTLSLRYLPDLKLLLEWWSNEIGDRQCFDEVDPVTLREGRDKLKRGRAPSTVNRYLSALRKVWNWGRGCQVIPVDRLWPPGLHLAEPRGRVRFLDDRELAALLKAAEVDPVVRAAIVVSVATGLRQGELLRLSWADVDLAEGAARVTVHESKTDERRAVHLTSTAVAALKALRKLPVVSPVHVFVLSDGRPLRKGLLEMRWRKIRTAAGLQNFHWHDMRHTCASILLKSGATLAMVGGVLGHRSPAMTQRYSHLVQGAAVTGHDKLDQKLRGDV